MEKSISARFIILKYFVHFSTVFFFFGGGEENLFKIVDRSGKLGIIANAMKGYFELISNFKEFFVYPPDFLEKFSASFWHVCLKVSAQSNVDPACFHLEQIQTAYLA